MQQGWIYVRPTFCIDRCATEVGLPVFQRSTKRKLVVVDSSHGGDRPHGLFFGRITPESWVSEPARCYSIGGSLLVVKHMQ